MKKVLLLLLILLLGAAALTKPDDKTCIIEGVRAVWGNIMPDVYKAPVQFENFMNLHSPSVKVKDWVFFKQVKYTIQNDQKTVAFGAFRNVFATVRPIEIKSTIPPLPGSRK